MLSQLAGIMNKRKSIFYTRRSIRRFQQKEIPFKILQECVNTARLAPSAGNIQPLEYIIVTRPDLREKLFPHLHWAGSLPDWNPDEDEQPMAYIIVIFKETDSLFYQYDVGISLAHIVLCAESNGLGSCILKNIDIEEIKHLLKIPEVYNVDSIVALGYKKEHPILETNDQNTTYWLDDHDVLHVPKYPLETILHIQTFL